MRGWFRYSLCYAVYLGTIQFTQFNNGHKISIYIPFSYISHIIIHYFQSIRHTIFIDFAGSSSQLIADVDCTAEGKPLCDAAGVRGYPTIKWGDPADLQDYQGGRTYDDLKKFADENLKPMCSPKNIDLCDDAKKADIQKFQGMSDADLAAAIVVEEKKLEDAEEEFKTEVQKLQDRYSALSTEKDEKIEAVKNSGLGLMKSVQASKPAGSDEL